MIGFLSLNFQTDSSSSHLPKKYTEKLYDFLVEKRDEIRAENSNLDAGVIARKEVVGETGIDLIGRQFSRAPAEIQEISRIYQSVRTYNPEVFVSKHQWQMTPACTMNNGFLNGIRGLDRYYPNGWLRPFDTAQAGRSYPFSTARSI